jgi:hypothetical protein
LKKLINKTVTPTSIKQWSSFLKYLLGKTYLIKVIMHVN